MTPPGHRLVFLVTSIAAGQPRIQSPRHPTAGTNVPAEDLLELKSQLSLVEQMTRHTDGVVDVTMKMTYRRDDTHERLPAPMSVDITHEPWR